MKIVIIGLGTIGKTILKNLSGEGRTITIIDDDKRKIEYLIEKYDVLSVVGNDASMDIQKETGVRESDIVIALTQSDDLYGMLDELGKRFDEYVTIFYSISGDN